MAYAYQVRPGTKIKLRKYDPDRTVGLRKDEALDRFAKLSAELGGLQEELYAAGQHAALVILQGMDTSGKDGTIRHVFEAVNPQACHVWPFKVPTEEERAHDFLWRVHQVVPRKGLFGIFNRSHYEDVLVTRVRQLTPKDIWKARYAQINDFEALLAASGTIVLKFFLHIGKAEQKERLLKRESDPTKAWKLSAGDWDDHARWDDYMEAYEDTLSKCSTTAAPWYIVPANRKWFRDLAVCDAVVQTLKGYRSAWRATLAEMSKTRLAELKAIRKRLRSERKS
jgi:PPK2 family polyphosphate:nucleotide phosphotransferase